MDTQTRYFIHWWKVGYQFGETAFIDDCLISL